MNREIQTAILDLLRLDREPSHAATANFNESQWKIALDYCDSNQLTLPLARSIKNAPDWVVERLRRSACANRTRQRKLFDLCRHFDGIDHLILKGFTHWPYFCPDAELRTQYDLDIYCSRASIDAARDVAYALGYEPMEGRERFPTDHLPTLIRKTGWEWRGDFFDVEIPFSIELHFRFWDRDLERFGPPDLDAFWDRREVRQWQDLQFTSLNEADSLGYACLHALRHLLRGGGHPRHFYEIGWFLERQHSDAFWEKWRELHSPELRTIQAICFRFAHDWFRCRMAPIPQEEVDGLPESVRNWFANWSRSPLEASFRPNKDELWLHLSLLDSAADRAVVFRRRVIPLKPPGAVDAIHIPDEKLTLVLRIRRQWRYIAYVASRMFHHIRVLLPLTVSGARWWLAQSGLTADYWRFYGAFLIFNFALMIFYLLYNLHLVDQGFDEGFAGRVTSAMQAGSLIACLVAGFAAARAGLRSSLIFCFVTTGIACVLRTIAPGKTELLITGFVGGAVQSIWAVCLAPAVTMITTEKSRSLAFSVTFATGVGLGIGAGVVGGRLPGMLHSTRNALLLASVMAPLAVLPILGMKRLAGAFNSEKRMFAVNPFLTRYLGAIAIWGAATGAFNPFFTLFFSRSLHFSVEKIGGLYSAVQAAQMVAMLLSPLVLKRFGITPAIALMQVATGIALAGLGVSPPILAGWIYAMYTAFQCMSEPGMYNLLMTNTPPEQRTGASALNFVTLFGSQAIAAWAAGECITRYGYRPVLLIAGLVALVAARAMMLVTRSR